MIDLHIHTKYSDGEYNEFEILEKIKQAGLSEFAICDHDTIEGSERVYNLLRNSNTNLQFHSGVELTCRVKKYKEPINCHILILDFNYNDKTMIKLIEQVSILRRQKIDRMVKLIKEVYNIEVFKEEIDEILKNTNSFGKPHMYKILQTKGNFDREEYYKVMNTLKSADLKLEAEEVIRLLKDKNVKIVLAHPTEIKKEYNLSFEEIYEFVKYLQNLGLNSLETKHSAQTEFESSVFSLMAEDLNLLQTQGSDYHGPTVKPNVTLGKVYKKSA